MSNKIIYSVDVEKDIHKNSYEGVTVGLKNFEKLCDKYNIKPVLFVTAECLKENSLIFKKLHKKGWEISLHGYSHKRFDEMSYSEKENDLKKSLEIFKKYLKIRPRGFRAPQHSIDDATLDLLEKYKFEYDSSYTPLNALQLLFFPKKIKLWLKTFFSPVKEYNIRKNLKEIPVSSLILPFVSLTVRIFPKFFLRLFVKSIKTIYPIPVFYAHSWDFIELPNSRIDRTFGHDKLLKKLEYLMQNEK